MDDQLSVGDAVRMKHIRGPAMIIEQMIDPPWVNCIWFDGDEVRRDKMLSVLLRKAD